MASILVQTGHAYVLYSASTPGRGEFMRLVVENSFVPAETNSAAVRVGPAALAAGPTPRNDEEPLGPRRCLDSFLVRYECGLENRLTAGTREGPGGATSGGAAAGNSSTERRYCFESRQDTRRHFESFGALEVVLEGVLVCSDVCGVHELCGVQAVCEFHEVCGVAQAACAVLEVCGVQAVCGV